MTTGIDNYNNTVYRIIIIETFIETPLYVLSSPPFGLSFVCTTFSHATVYCTVPFMLFFDKILAGVSKIMVK